jgi:hypothetical protein
MNSIFMMLIGQIFTIEVKRWKARWNLYPIDQVNSLKMSNQGLIFTNSLYQIVGDVIQHWCNRYNSLQNVTANH